MAASTGRRETPLPASGPVVPLAARLRQLRRASGLTYKQLAARANYTTGALSKAANGRELASWDVVRAYVIACSGTDEDVLADVETLYAEAKSKLKVAKTLAKKTRRRAQGQDVPDPRLGSRVVQKVFENVVLHDSATSRGTEAYSTADPAEVGNYEQFATALDQIRTEAQLSVQEVLEAAARSGSPLGRTTVYDILGTKARPSEQFIRAYLTACGMAPPQVQAWVDRLVEIQEETRRVEAARIALQELTRSNSSFEFDADWPTLSKLLRLGAEAAPFPGQRTPPAPAVAAGVRENGDAAASRDADEGESSVIGSSGPDDDRAPVLDDSRPGDGSTGDPGDAQPSTVDRGWRRRLSPFGARNGGRRRWFWR